MITPSEVPSCKIILLGNSGVGKTSLVSRWTSPTFDPSIRPTIGVNHQRKRIQLGSDEVDLFIWDTAGQEQFRALTPLYTRSASFAVITVAVNDLASFGSIASWIDLVAKTCDHVPPLALAVNKMDLAEEIVLSEEQILEKYAQPFEDRVFFVSALDGRGVGDMFARAAADAFEHYKRTNGFVPRSDAGAREDNGSGCC